MRQILFRGIKTGTKGEWVYGSFISNSIDAPCIIDYDAEQHEVYEHSVSQFTGLLDKTKNRVFEGDKILYDEIEGIVLFKDSSFFVRFEYLRSLHLLGELERDLEVIGNIYED